jgi:hypothetical protein
MAGPDQIAAGGVDGVGGSVVLAGLPGDRVAVVLAAVMHGHPDPQDEGGLPVLDGAPAVGVVGVGGHAELGIEPVEGLFGVPLSGRMRVVVDLVAMVPLVGAVGVVVGPGADLGVLGGQRSDGVAVAPVAWVELESFGGELPVV